MFFLCFVLFFFDKMSQKDSGFSSISELAVVFFLLDKTDRVVSTRDSKPQKVLPRLQEFPSCIDIYIYIIYIYIAL